MKQIVIIGAGPAGCSAALALAGKAGLRTLLIERYPLPRTKVCGSGLSPWTLTFLDQIGVGEAIRKHAFRIHGASIYGDKSSAIELRGRHQTAVLLRSELDRLLAEEAQRRGVELRDNLRVQRILREGDKVIGVETSEGPIEADFVIDCSGARGNFSPRARGNFTLHTMLGWYEGVQGASDVVELFFDSELKPHYGWVFPESERRVNIGICFAADAGGDNARERFESFLERRLAKRLRGAEQIGRWVGHPVHASAWPHGEMASPGCFAAGEAAQMVDVATAEGIYHGLVSGRVAGEYVAELAATDQLYSREARGRYPWLMRRALGGRMLGGRALMGALRTPVLDTALRFSNYDATRSLLRRAFTGLYHG